MPGLPCTPAILVVLSTALVAGCSSCASNPTDASPESAAPPHQEVPVTLTRADARHLLGRLTFGPRPGEVEAATGLRVEAWLDAQLEPTQTDPGAAYAAAFGSPLEVSTAYAKKMKSGGGNDGAAITKALGKINVGRLLTDLGEGEMLRATFSEAQLQEVLTDFFTDHFNVFARKGKVRFFAGDFVARAIRPHVFGRFETMLRATAEHPAMLVYLDNERSSAKRGINENYARELLELHTLGVDGGYAQADVEAVAKILSGWGLANLNKDPNAAPFRFSARHHVRGPKTALGATYAEAGVEEGRALLGALAAHPATARHLATKLCRRFVADVPPAGCIDAVRAAYARTEGSISEMMRALVAHPSFWAAAARGAKTKRPKTFVVSALRALDARPTDKPGLARTVARLGQGVLGQPAPTGWPDEAARWTSASAALARMDFALQLAQGKLRGADPRLDQVVGVAHADVDWAAVVQDKLLDTDVSEETRRALSQAVAAQTRPDARRAIAVAIGLASPEFSRR